MISSQTTASSRQAHPTVTLVKRKCRRRRRHQRHDQSIPVTEKSQSTKMTENSVHALAHQESMPTIMPWTEDRLMTKKDVPRACTAQPKWICLGLISSALILLLALALPLLLFYLVTPHMVRSNSTEIAKYGNHCAGVSPYALWQIDTNETIVMDIDTSGCAFERTPLYFTSVNGNSAHHCLTGYDAIYSPTRLAFRIYARSICSWTSSIMYGYSRTYQWDVNWMGYYD